MLFLQQNVGFLVTLFLFVFCLELAITRLQGRVWAWGVVYLVVAFLLFLAALLAFGFHV